MTQTSGDQRNSYDVIVLGGGAAGLMAAATAAKRGRKVIVVEVSNKLGKKILMSGGGRCNFTNLEVKAEHFLCDNPHFVKSALSQFGNWDFIGMVAAHGIDYHEKDLGQLFCDHSSKDILAMLIDECETNNVEFIIGSEVSTVEQCVANRFSVEGEGISVNASSLIVATGGLSIPSLGGATGLGYRLAEQFGLNVTPRSASLVPFTLSGHWQEFSSALSGVSLPVYASVPNKGFYESLLFTHRGLSGPAILQLSNYWKLGEGILLDLLPNMVVSDELKHVKTQSPNLKLETILSKLLPNSLVTAMMLSWFSEFIDKPIHECKNSQLDQIGAQLNQWRLTPSGTEGYRTAEVTKGGVCVDQISSKTMQHKRVDNLYFIGEVLDVTGHLGGYNFQWAWSSGYVAGMNA
ncbi:NAD(P)/FAD-dependent oxidoreductase [Arenicella sp. 4NH20-0111]|uniref:NAD(P)/FAD-dependent oxidoreductase n=1 Tax=Arenicella sp. 4NH20-0111 TaxID=3127648 RepID=UPI003342B921